MRPLRLSLLAVALVLGMVSCTTASEKESRFSLAEFSIHGPAGLSPGSVSITADNVGEYPHTLVITDSDGTVVAATDLIPPGQSVDLDVELTSGQYQFTCRIVAQTEDGDLVDHYEAGMNQVVTVSG